MRNCLTCPFRALCRRTPAELLATTSEVYFDRCPAENVDRVLAMLEPLEIERIARDTLITLDPATDWREIAKGELLAAYEAGDWEDRPALN